MIDTARTRPLAACHWWLVHQCFSDGRRGHAGGHATSGTVARILPLAFLLVLGVESRAASDGGPRRVDLPHGHCLVAAPEDLKGSERAPLIVCLHGTNTRAADILAFWQSLEARLPCVLIAPQGVDAGWRKTDLPLIREVIDELIPSLPIDRERVLLTGHSAGGAMALHLLFVESFPCTAVAVTANYVPPSVTAEHVKKRTEIPIFYAVGQTDINRPRMRDGLELLRNNGARATVIRPEIGHVLDREVGQAAMKWFEEQCRESVERRLIQAQARGSPEEAVEHRGAVGLETGWVERIVANRRTHFPDQAERASALLETLTERGRRGLMRARAMIEAGDLLAARAVLLEIERDYRTASLQEKARKLRVEVESDPAVARHLREKASALARAEAEALWREIAKALDAADHQTCRRHCTTLVTLYPDTERAGQARRLLRALNRVSPD
jgi:hypothetical protein